MPTIIISVILAIFCACAIYNYVHKLRHGGGCCGEHEAPEKRIKPKDRNKGHYPYAVVLTIDGMTCENCARRVENALNQMGDVWATVNLGKRQALVLLKWRPEEGTLRDAVQNAGYTVLSVTYKRSGFSKATP